MNCKLSEIINPIKVVVFLTLLFAVCTLHRKTKSYFFLIILLWICFITEVVDSVLLYFGKPIRFFYSISIFFHHTLWMLFLYRHVRNKKAMQFFIGFFLIFAIVNFIYIEWINEYNYYTFIIGAFFYLLFFLSESYSQLHKENLIFFTLNNYILLFAPIFFFFGMSLMFGFKIAGIRGFKIYNGITLYDLIVNISCLAYYSLINVYIYRENKTWKK